MSEGTENSGVLCAGGDNGVVYVYDTMKLMNNADDCLMHKLEEHHGAIAALDVNPFQVLKLIIHIVLISLYVSDVNKCKLSYISVFDLI